MAIITLTTDMGNKDHYVAGVKAAILKQLHDARIVDVSHAVPPFDIFQASYILRNVYDEFPKGSVHIIGVNPEAIIAPESPEREVAHLAVDCNGHYFIGADNGIFSLLFDRIPDRIFELNISNNPDDLTFPTKSVFVTAACHIARGGTLEVIGKERKKVRQAQEFRAVVEGDVIRGMVIYIDSYGNVITNITKELFDSVGKGRSFEMNFRRDEYAINEISSNYGDVDEGEMLALFGANNNLQIAINRGAEGSGGGASGLLSLKMRDTIRIEFTDAPSDLSQL